MQKAYKASYPPGEAKEDWQVINELSKYISSKNLYDSKESLEKNMTNYLNLHNSKNNNSTKFENNFTKEKIFIKDIDYYYSNAIARASKTMSACRKEKINLKSTGTEG
jgi:NADH-quinone oxidoreductase subunit G